MISSCCRSRSLLLGAWLNAAPVVKMERVRLPTRMITTSRHIVPPSASSRRSRRLASGCLTSLDVRAIRIVQAIRSDQEIVQHDASHDCLVDDPRYVLDPHAAVPDALRVNDQVRPVLTLIETAGHIGS